MSSPSGSEIPFAACPRSPNCVSSIAVEESQLIAPIHFRGTHDEALKGVETVLQQMARMEITKRQPQYLSAIATSRIFRFKDDLEFFADGNSRQLHYRSASRIGYSDLGANRKRLERIIEQLLKFPEFSRTPIENS